MEVQSHGITVGYYDVALQLEERESKVNGGHMP